VLVVDVPQDDLTAAGLRAASDAFALPPLRTDHHSRLAALHEKARRQQWEAATDLDWTVPSSFASPLPDDSDFALACFHQSPLARHGRGMWDTFRWEFQSWMVSQFVSGEQAALLTATRLLDVVPDADARSCLGAQVLDEARHVDVFSRYLREKVPAPYTISHSLAGLLSDALKESRWDVTILGLQIMVEALALAAFRMAESTFHDRLIQQICRLSARDEARHVSFGVTYLQSIYPQLTQAELREREEFVLEALGVVGRRFLLEQIWERIGIAAEDGVAFVKTNPLMIQYRQTMCAKIVDSLLRIGLINDRIRSRLADLGLLGFPAARVALTVGAAAGPRNSIAGA
jgi:Long-chain fatty aldehyde decarbonylase